MIRPAQVVEVASADRPGDRARVAVRRAGQEVAQADRVELVGVMVTVIVVVGVAVAAAAVLGVVAGVAEVEARAAEPAVAEQATAARLLSALCPCRLLSQATNTLGRQPVSPPRASRWTFGPLAAEERSTKRCTISQ